MACSLGVLTARAFRFLMAYVEGGGTHVDERRYKMRRQKLRKRNKNRVLNRMTALNHQSCFEPTSWWWRIVRRLPIARCCSVLLWLAGCALRGSLSLLFWRRRPDDPLLPGRPKLVRVDSPPPAVSKRRRAKTSDSGETPRGIYNRGNVREILRSTNPVVFGWCFLFFSNATTAKSRQPPVNAL